MLVVLCWHRRRQVLLNTKTSYAVPGPKTPIVRIRVLVMFRAPYVLSSAIAAAEIPASDVLLVDIPVTVIAVVRSVRILRARCVYRIMCVRLSIPRHVLNYKSLQAVIRVVTSTVIAILGSVFRSDVSSLTD